MFTVGSPASSLSCLQSLAAGGVGSSSLAALTPSLANHYRDDLVNHVRGWPADVCEKQVSTNDFVDMIPRGPSISKNVHFIHCRLNDHIINYTLFDTKFGSILHNNLL